jgi:hypothetical protein
VNNDDMTGSKNRADRTRRRALVALVWALALAASTVTPGAARHRANTAADFPGRLSDDQFWQLVSGFSEGGGSFLSDNFVSNEQGFQEVVPRLSERPPRGGAYLGVGPDQNFTYIAALHPQVAFIVDIRRQNLMQHLMYKAIFELSPDRAEFLSHLFSRPRPPGLVGRSSAATLIAAYAATAADETLYQRNLTAVVRRLTRNHHFALTSEDLISLNYVYRAFFSDGPDIQYFVSRAPNLRFPTYGELLQATDADGEPRGYLATERNYRTLRDFEQRNLLVPIVGDFAGDKALPAVGRYLREHGLDVAAFYVSNVEVYLFNQPPAWQRFYAHLGALPTDERSLIIRSYNLPTPIQATRIRLATVLDSIEGLGRAVKDGSIKTYSDVIARSQ